MGSRKTDSPGRLRRLFRNEWSNPFVYVIGAIALGVISGPLGLIDRFDEQTGSQSRYLELDTQIRSRSPVPLQTEINSGVSNPDSLPGQRPVDRSLLQARPASPSVIQTFKGISRHPSSEIVNRLLDRPDTARAIAVTNVPNIEATLIRLQNPSCTDGVYDRIRIKGGFTGQMAPVVQRMVRAAKRCSSEHLMPIDITSPGGKIRDALNVAALYKRSGVEINAIGQCSSSCAISMVAATARTVAEGTTILFHAPYSEESGHVECSSATEAEYLRSYFVAAMGERKGQRVFDANMSYCGNRVGWTLYPSAARNFGVTTH